MDKNSAFTFVFNLILNLEVCLNIVVYRYVFQMFISFGFEQI